MIRRKTLLYYLFTAMIFAGLKGWYANTTTDNLSFLLSPVSSLVNVATNMKSAYIKGAGFYYANADILINKSCSGFGFASICFLLLCYLVGKYINKSGVCLLLTLSSLMLAILFSIVVNSCRIILSISLKQNNEHLQTVNAMLSHETIGAVIYLFFLIAIYISFEYIFKTINKNHESTIKSKMASFN